MRDRILAADHEQARRPHSGKGRAGEIGRPATHDQRAHLARPTGGQRYAHRAAGAPAQQRQRQAATGRGRPGRGPRTAGALAQQRDVEAQRLVDRILHRLLRREQVGQYRGVPGAAETIAIWRNAGMLRPDIAAGTTNSTTEACAFRAVYLEVTVAPLGRPRPHSAANSGQLAKSCSRASTNCASGVRLGRAGQSALRHLSFAAVRLQRGSGITRRRAP
jgi:hypothetical protein